MNTLYGSIVLVLVISALICILIIKFLHNTCKSYERLMDKYEMMECDYNQLIINYKYLSEKLAAYKRIIDTYREG